MRNKTWPTRVATGTQLIVGNCGSTQLPLMRKLRAMGVNSVGGSGGKLVDSSAWLRLQPKDALTIMMQADGTKTARIELPVRSLNSQLGKGKDLLANIESVSVGPPFVGQTTELQFKRSGRNVQLELPGFRYGGTGTAPMTLQVKLKNGHLVLLDVASQRTRFDESRPKAAHLRENIDALTRSTESQRNDLADVEAGLKQEKGGFAPVPEWLRPLGYDVKYSTLDTPDGQWPVGAVRDTIRNMKGAIARDERQIAQDQRELQSLETPRGQRRAGWAVKTPGNGWSPR